MKLIKTTILATMSAALITPTSCVTTETSDGDTPIIDRQEIAVEDGVFTIEILEALGRVSSPAVSPDGTKVLYTVSYESVEQNKSNADLYVVNIDGTEPTRITRTASSELSATWIDNGNRIAYIANYKDKPQLWIMNADGSEPTVASNLENGVGGFLFSPDGEYVLLVSTVKYGKTSNDIYVDLPKANARIVDDLMYKHWDEWVVDIPHPFLAKWNGKQVSDVIDIMNDEPFESPMKPFGGIESFAWAPDSKSLVYVSRKKTGLEYAVSTDSKLYLYTIENGTTRCLTEEMMGYDTDPVFSPDGSKLAWLSMEHDGYESDKKRIFVMDMNTESKTDLTTDWDYTADAIAWRPDGNVIYFIAAKDGVTPIFSIDVATHEVNVMAQGQYDYVGLAPIGNDSIVTMRHSMIAPNEVFLVNTVDSQVTPITSVNTELLAQVDMPRVELRQVPTTDGKLMATWIVYPPKFDENRRYPAILYCQGGPQQAVSQFWSYRWNLALMASNGYIVIAPNRRGLPGFGTEWNAQISKDYPGQNMRDYLSAVDDMKKEPYIDAQHIGAVGASYGGFSVYWLAGNHDGRFAALIAHAGIFNMEAQYLETEEMWFANWDMGGAPWEKGNAAAQRTFNMSPHKFVDRWDTPILVTHGEYDYRILSSQGEMAFNAARLRGVPARMVIFPDENHWILKPQNAVLWQREFFGWLDKWLKPASDDDTDNATND